MNVLVSLSVSVCDELHLNSTSEVLIQRGFYYLWPELCVQTLLYSSLIPCYKMSPQLMRKLDTHDVLSFQVQTGQGCCFNSVVEVGQLFQPSNIFTRLLLMIDRGMLESPPFWNVSIPLKYS